MNTCRMPDFRFRHRRLLAVLLLIAVPAGYPLAGQQSGSFGVSVQVLRPNLPAQVRALPLPSPGHVMRDDAQWRHYYFEGSLADARSYYLEQLQRLGYELRGEQPIDARNHTMLWQREGEITLVKLAAAMGSAPTRISLRVMTDVRAHARG
jgi:hypothetical protein